MGRERQQKVTKKLLSDENILYLNLNKSTQLSKLIKLFILNECGLLYVNHLNKVENYVSHFANPIL